MRPIAVAFVALFAAASVFAAGLGTFRDWPDSPAGYFLTKAEREQWAQLTSEADAAKFVDAFLAKRGPKFTDEVKERVANADKYLTIGKTPGSKTLRGKVIVLMGPPSALHVASHTKSDVKRDNPAVAGALSNIGPSSGGGGRNSEAGPTSGGSIGTSSDTRVFSITYDGKAAKTVKREKITFEIEADAATGKDRFTTRDGEKDAEAIFEAAAQASIRKP